MLTPEEQKELDERVSKKIEEDKKDRAASNAASIYVLGTLLYLFIIGEIAEDNHNLAAKIVVITWVFAFCVGRTSSYLIKKNVISNKKPHFYLWSFFTTLLAASSLCIIIEVVLSAIELFLK